MNATQRQAAKLAREGVKREREHLAASNETDAPWSSKQGIDKLKAATVAMNARRHGNTRLK